MLPAPDLRSIMERHDELRRDADATQLEHLVSIVFTTPKSVVFGDLADNHAYFDERTGAAWDLFFAGYYMYGGKGYDPHGYPVTRAKVPRPDWWFSPRAFNELRLEIELAHLKAVRGQQEVTRMPWQYSGRAELVSFFVYEGAMDWLSLHSTILTDSRGGYHEGRSLGEVVERHAEWRDPEGFGRRFEPGWSDRGQRPRSVKVLRQSLMWTASQSGSAALGVGVTKLIENLLR
jgi:hypothetical protein